MRIAQSDKYEGNDWWSWSVWIDGTAEELRGIESVTYTLHPTFANPVRRVTDRRSKFRLDENGWGGFTIYGRVEMKAGKTRNLKRELALYYPKDHEADAVTIRINDVTESDPVKQAATLETAIKDAAPDATVERASVEEVTSGGSAQAAVADAISTAVNVVLTGPTVYSVAKGIQGWLARNPQASVDLLKKGELIANQVTGSTVLKTLTSLKE
jgi:transcription initiation factor IIF auxiliary subunit